MRISPSLSPSSVEGFCIDEAQNSDESSVCSAAEVSLGRRAQATEENAAGPARTNDDDPPASNAEPLDVPEEDDHDLNPKTSTKHPRNFTALQPWADARPPDTAVVDWSRYRNRRYGQEPLWSKLSIRVIGDLIGWATAGPGGDCHPEQENPLLGLPSAPLPPSYLDVLITTDTPASSASLAESAEVAVGMALEDMMTAALLPLAGLHVLRCRELEANCTSIDHNLNTHESQEPRRKKRRVHPVTGESVAFVDSPPNSTASVSEQWTLPPDEAILKLLEDGVIADTGMDIIPTASRFQCDISNGPTKHSFEWTQQRLKTLDLPSPLTSANPEFISAFLSHGYTLQKDVDTQSSQPKNK